MHDKLKLMYGNKVKEVIDNVYYVGGLESGNIIIIIGNEVINIGEYTLDMERNNVAICDNDGIDNRLINLKNKKVINTFPNCYTNKDNFWFVVDGDYINVYDSKFNRLTKVEDTLGLPTLTFEWSTKDEVKLAAEYFSNKKSDYAIADIIYNINENKLDISI